MNAEKPAPTALDTEAHLSTAPARAALDTLTHALGTREPFVAVVGRDGLGKRALVEAAIARLGDRVHATRLQAPLSLETPIVNAIVASLGGTALPGLPEIAARERLIDTVAALNARGRTAVVAILAAHRLSADELQQLQRAVVRAVAQRAALEVWLVGEPALEATLASPALRLLCDRTGTCVRPALFSPADTRVYLEARALAAGDPGFSRTACLELHTASQGLPAMVERLAAESQARARRQGVSVITGEHVRAAASELRSRRLSDASLRAHSRVPAHATPEPVLGVKRIVPAAPVVAPAPVVPVVVAAPVATVVPVEVVAPAAPRHALRRARVARHALTGALATVVVMTIVSVGRWIIAPATSSLDVALPASARATESAPAPTDSTVLSDVPPSVASASDTPGVTVLRHTLLVGVYADPAEARAEQVRLTGRSAWHVWLAQDATGAAWRVCMGSFAERSLAESAASSLRHRRLVGMAQVLELPAAEIPSAPVSAPAPTATL